MKKNMKRSISLILTVLMVFTAMPATSWADTGASAKTAASASMKAQAVTPAKTAEAVSKFTDALSKFYADTSKLSGMSTFLTRFGGIASAASGVIGILQMSGVIKDPTQQALGEILGTVKDIQTQLNNMDKKLDDINTQLVGIAAKQEEHNRNNKAADMLKNWREFNRDYTEPLDNMINEYQGKIDVGIRAWWKQDSHEGIYLLYTEVSSQTYSLTYSKKAYAEGVPDKADNEEVIARSKCIGIPADCMPDTAKMSFDINRYQEDFEARMAENFMQAVNQKKLDAEEGFYQAWTKATSEFRKEVAAKYAHEVMNTLLYHIACDVMDNNNEWVIKVTNAYKNYCKNVLEQDSGVNAMLNAMYLTHGFEGEIKQDIKDFCDQMAVKAGVYGEFALTCAGQDSLQSLSDRQDIQALFADTVTSLYDKKNKALKGHDNYCYITGTLVSHDVIEARSETTIKYTTGTTDDYEGYSSKDWTITVPSILDSVYSQVLYDQYQALKQGKTSFSSYLKAYGAFPTDNWNGNIMVRYGGAQTFPLSEGIRMKASGVYAGEDYFNSGSYYNIDVGTGSKVEQKYYHVHDKVLYDAFNLGTGTLAVNQMAAARAMYGESHWNWTTDECWFFSTDGSKYSNAWDKSSSPKWITEKYRARFNVLKLTPVHDLNGYEDPEDPFFAFDRASLTMGISNWIGPKYLDTRTALTDISFKKSSYTYTGKAIKPAITVKAGSKTVPAGNYSVSYTENTKTGYGMVKVTAKGDKYSGTVMDTFQIVPKGNTIKTVKKNGSKATVKWKKQAAKMSTDRITGYQIRYSTKSSMKNAKTTSIKGYKKTSKQIKGLKKNKKYYFQIRTYMKSGTKTIYSKWSSKKSAK